MTVVGNVELPLQEFRRLDLNSEELGVPVRTLMARAGKALAEAAREARQDALVVILAGKGNNGGDGFAAANFLERWEIPYEVVLLEPEASVRGAAAGYLALVPKERRHPWKGSKRTAWKGALVLDCMLGSGIRGRPRAPYDAAIKWANQHAGKIVACDVPSGLGTALAIKPTQTVTFHARKQGMTKATCGQITVAPIGIPKAAETEIGLGDLDAGVVRPATSSHKGDNGRVLIVGGGPFSGAPHYAGMAALRSGADLVHVATCHDAAAVIGTWGPDLMVHAVCEGGTLAPVALPAIEALLERVDAVVVGPGLGTSEAARALARDVVIAARKRNKSVVIDADGLDALDASVMGAGMVVTPHGKEFQDLSKWKPTQANVTRFAREHGVVVLRKGAEDVVAGERTKVCKRGHPAMTVGGTGDVLAGSVGALMAKGASPFDAACAAAYLVGSAGEIAAEMRSIGMTASDVIEALPLVLRRLD